MNLAGSPHGSGGVSTWVWWDLRMGLGEAGSERDVGLAGALGWWCGVAVVPLRE